MTTLTTNGVRHRKQSRQGRGLPRPSFLPVWGLEEQAPPEMDPLAAREAISHPSTGR